MVTKLLKNLSETGFLSLSIDYNFFNHKTWKLFGELANDKDQSIVVTSWKGKTTTPDNGHVQKLYVNGLKFVELLQVHFNEAYFYSAKTDKTYLVGKYVFAGTFEKYFPKYTSIWENTVNNS